MLPAGQITLLLRGEQWEEPAARLSKQKPQALLVQGNDSPGQPHSRGADAVTGGTSFAGRYHGLLWEEQTRAGLRLVPGTQTGVIMCLLKDKDNWSSRLQEGRSESPPPAFRPPEANTSSRKPP